MANFTPVASLLGGLLIGIASVWLLAANGRIAGISGILHGLFAQLIRRKDLKFEKTDIDAPLILGAAVFGLGWGIGGYCPGPALTALSNLSTEAFVFVVAMIVGGIVGKIPLA